MTVLRDVLAELFSMFVADARLTASVLAVVALAALLIFAAHVGALSAGAVLLIGCLGVLVEAVLREARRRGMR
jgi:hypothetical protein